MSWREVTDLLDRPEWFSAMYSLAAHGAHDALVTGADPARARRQALLLALACAATVRRRERNFLSRAVARHPWPLELNGLDKELFPTTGRIPPPLPPQSSTRVALRYRIRHRDDQAQDFTRFLERTVEPSALILLAGMPPVAKAKAAKPWSRDALIAELAETAVKPERELDVGRLIATALEQPELDGRAHYNLACYYALADDVAAARKHLHAAVFAASGAQRTARIAGAKSDPTLKRALDGWDDAKHVLPEPKTTEATDRSELEQIAAVGGYAKPLAELGIESPASLMTHLRSRTSRRELAEDLDADRRLLDRWQGLLELLAIDGIGAAQLNLLEAAGITTPKQLRAGPVRTLHRRLVQANTARDLVRTVPSEAVLLAWREATTAAQ